MSQDPIAALTAIESAMIGGVLEVDYGDRKVKYRSAAELKALHDFWTRKAQVASGVDTSVSFARFDMD